MPRPPGRRRVGHRSPGILPRLGLLLTFGLLTATVPTPVSAAGRGLVVLAQARYDVQPDAHRVHVTIDAVATSFEPNTPDAQIYYSGVNFAVQAGAANVVAVAGGQQIGAAITEHNDDFTVVEVTFGRGVFFHQNYAYTVAFDLVDAGGAGTRDLRIGRSLTAFPVWAFGTQSEPGASVRVDLPKGFTPDLQGDEMDASKLPDGGTRLRADPADPFAFFTYISADRPGAFAENEVRLDLNDARVKILIRNWEDDPQWGQRVTQLIRRGLPALQDLIGVDYPAMRPLTVEEAATSRLGEYAGIYDPDTAVIRVRYDADAFVTLHEAAHIWFNGTLFRDRWIGEAWAEFYGVEAGRSIDANGHTFELTDALLKARFPLNDWGAIGVESLDVEDFAYAASYSLAQDIVERTDLDRMQLVWQAAAAGAMAYQPSHPANEPVTGVPIAVESWQRLLDLLEERTSVEYTDLWQDWVVNRDQVPLLATRQSARHQYAEVVDAAGEWELPLSIRSYMGGWEFDATGKALTQASEVLKDRDAIVTLATELDLTPPGTLREAFEGNDGMEAAASEAAAEIAAVVQLADATDRIDDEPGVLESIGWLGRDPQSELVAARAAFQDGDLPAATRAATEAIDAQTDAADVGRGRVAVGGAGILLLDGIGMGILISRRRRRQRALLVA
jgi:hypothetical protein